MKNLCGFGSALLQLLLQMDSQPSSAAVLGILVQQGKGCLIPWNKGVPTAALSDGFTQVLSVCRIPSLRALLMHQFSPQSIKSPRAAPTLPLCAAPGRDTPWDAPGAPVTLTALKNDLGTWSTLIKQETSNIPGI